MRQLSLCIFMVLMAGVPDQLLTKNSSLYVLVPDYLAELAKKIEHQNCPVCGLESSWLYNNTSERNRVTFCCDNSMSCDQYGL